ncbi:MAG: decaprenyl-phosphate phosphoribosyltransferase [Deltaproteobacteria bacterium]|nr:decaprenyl-phosphate phosphoribosyltransferase [Deltaproteobacteria bacterium]
MKTVRLLIVTMRPAQWVKNLFVAAPVLFAKTHTIQDPGIIGRAALATLVFILLSGSVYIMNDILDADRDRLHPVKKNRPIAVGALDVRSAVAGGLAVLALALGCGYLLGGAFNLVATTYLALNIGYSWSLKNTPWLDVFIIASGFLLRIIAGSFAIGLATSEISYYLILCTFLLALFLALGKRRHELSVLGPGKPRAVLERYRTTHLDAALFVVAVLTAVAYTLYTLSPRTRDYFGTDRLVYTVPFVVLGIYRFMALLKRDGDPRSPTDMMIRDMPFVVNILLWASLVAWVIYF